MKVCVAQLTHLFKRKVQAPDDAYNREIENCRKLAEIEANKLRDCLKYNFNGYMGIYSYTRYDISMR